LLKEQLSLRSWRQAGPAVLFHPFHRRLGEIQGLLGSLESRQLEEDSLLTLDDGDLRVLEERVNKELVFFELNFSDIFPAASHDILFEALRSAVALLRDAVFAFLGSDLHSIPEKRVDPTGVLTTLGIGISTSASSKPCYSSSTDKSIWQS